MFHNGEIVERCNWLLGGRRSTSTERCILRYKEMWDKIHVEIVGRRKRRVNGYIIAGKKLKFQSSDDFRVI